MVGLREAKKERTRADILAAAERLFTERGFAGTTTAQIASEAGIAEGTVFNYFGSKAEILVRLVHAVFQVEPDGAATAPPEDGDLTDRLMAMLEPHLAPAQRVAKSWLREVYAVAFDGGTEGRYVMAGLFDMDRLIGHEVRAELDRLQATGEVRADADLDAFMEIAYSVVMVGFAAYVLRDELSYSDASVHLRARLGLLVDSLLVAERGPAPVDGPGEPQ